MKKRTFRSRRKSLKRSSSFCRYRTTSSLAVPPPSIKLIHRATTEIATIKKQEEPMGQKKTKIHEKRERAPVGERWKVCRIWNKEITKS